MGRARLLGSTAVGRWRQCWRGGCALQSGAVVLLSPALLSVPQDGCVHDHNHQHRLWQQGAVSIHRWAVLAEQRRPCCPPEVAGCKHGLCAAAAADVAAAGATVVPALVPLLPMRLPLPVHLCHRQRHHIRFASSPHFAGLLLNNQMDDFSTPGQPNVYGIAPSKANFIRWAGVGASARHI